jgi:hypothetical protein
VVPIIGSWNFCKILLVDLLIEVMISLQNFFPLSLSLSSQINDLIVGLQFLFGRMIITILNLFSNYYLLFAVVVVNNVESFVYSFELFVWREDRSVE